MLVQLLFLVIQGHATIVRVLTLLTTHAPFDSMDSTEVHQRNSLDEFKGVILSHSVQRQV